MARSVHKHVRLDELSIVLVGCEHIGFNLFFACFGGQSANDVICFKPLHLQDGDVHGLKNLLNDGHSGFDVFGCFLPLSFIGRKDFMAKSFPMVESHSYIVGLLFVDDFLKGVAESHDGRSVQSFRVDSWRTYEGIVGTIDQCICIEQEKFCHKYCF